MNTHVFPGWGFSESVLHPIASGLNFKLANEQDAPFWIGWSLGGIQALSRCTAYVPRALVLISSTARFCGDGSEWPGLPPANLRALQRQLTRAPEDALLGFHRLCSENGTEEKIEQRAQDSLPLPLAAGLRELAELDVRAALKKITQPVLLLHGARDRVIPVAASRAMASLIQNARLVEHKEAGHDLPIQYRDWVVAQIREFLKQLPLK